RPALRRGRRRRHPPVSQPRGTPGETGVDDSSPSEPRTQAKGKRPGGRHPSPAEEPPPCERGLTPPRARHRGRPSVSPTGSTPDGGSEPTPTPKKTGALGLGRRCLSAAGIKFRTFGETC